MTGIPTGNRMHNVPKRGPPKYEDTVQKQSWNTCNCGPRAIPSCGTTLGYRTCMRCLHLIGTEGTRK